MFYKAKLEPNDEGGFIATLADVPEALAEGKTRDDALTEARNALETVLLHLAGAGEALPQAKAKAGIPVFISAHASAKIAILQAFHQSGISKTELANRLGKKEGEARRILDPFHATKLATLDEAMQALGQRLVVTVGAAE